MYTRRKQPSKHYIPTVPTLHEWTASLINPGYYCATISTVKMLQSGEQVVQCLTKI